MSMYVQNTTLASALDVTSCGNHSYVSSHEQGDRNMGDRPSIASRQTVIPETPAAGYFSITVSIDQGLVVAV